ncbi:hypothetical protein D9M71_580480 [compost metagenome]
MAFAVGAQRRILGIADIFKLDPVAGALAAGLIVAPANTQTGALKDIQQAFLVLCFAGLVILAGQAGEHARHRYRRLGSTGMHITESDKPSFLAQLRCGVTTVAQQPEILCPRALPHHQHRQ